MESIESLVDLALDKLTGVIGVFQGAEFLVAREEDIATILRYGKYFHQDSGRIEQYFRLSDVRDPSLNGTFFMISYKLNVDGILSDLVRGIETEERKAGKETKPLRDELKKIDDWHRKLEEETENYRRRGSFYHFLISSPEESKGDKIRKKGLRRQELAERINREYRNLWDLGSQREFFALLKQRYVEPYALEHVGPETYVDTQDKRPGAFSQFRLIGDIEAIQRILNFTIASPERISHLFRRICEKTPHMVYAWVGRYKGRDEQRWWRENYVLFTRVRKVRIIDGFTNRKYDFNIKE